MSQQNKGTPIHGGQTQSQPGRNDRGGSSGQKQQADGNKGRQSDNPDSSTNQGKNSPGQSGQQFDHMDNDAGSRGKNQQQQGKKDDSDNCGCEGSSQKDETNLSEDKDETSGRGNR